MLSSPKMAFLLELEYVDGTKECLCADESWEVTLDGPIRANGIFEGETFDASRCLEDGRPDYHNYEWKPVQLTQPPKGITVRQKMPPMRRIHSFCPEKIERLEDGTYIITVPEMVTGWAKVRLDVPKGSRVFITYGEQLDKTGHVQKIGLGEGACGIWWPDFYIQRDCFISGGFVMEYEPQFSYKGFQYIQIENYEKELTKEDIIIYRVANDVLCISEFECSNETLNRLHKLMRSTLLNNFQGKPTDTPVWEKNGWLGDLNCGLKSMVYNFNLEELLSDFVDTMTDCLHEFGVVPVMVPTANWGIENSPVWNSAFIYTMEVLYHYYGREDMIREKYPDMKRYTLSLLDEIKANGWVWRPGGLADWVAPACMTEGAYNENISEGAEICGSAFIYGVLKNMTEFAKAAGREKDISIYQNAMERIYEAFQKAFYREEQGIYETNFWAEIGNRTRYRQTSNIVPLAFGLVPKEKIKVVAEHLVEDIIKKGYHMDTGCIGTKYILPVLCDNGYADIAYKLLMQTTFPSWGYWLEKGATSAWEMWESSARSRDHYFLGTYEEFFFTHIVGLRELRNGCREVILQPCLLPELDYAKATIQTPYGTIRCGWERKGDGAAEIKLNVPDGVKYILNPPENMEYTVIVY